MKHEEDQLQADFFQWVAYQHLNNKPLSDVCWATPNGGNRRMIEAKRMKAQGVKAGVFDVTVSVACGGYHGLFIEFKVGDNTLSKEQKEFKAAMESEGYLCVICYSLEDAIDEVKMYLNSSTQNPVVNIKEVSGDEYKHHAVCRRMKAKFKTRRGAVGWLRNRGFNEFGERC